jgi:hypothetical protein
VRATRLARVGSGAPTRAATLNPAHVEALNSVPIDFYGDRKVMDIWDEYLQHLTNSSSPSPTWGQKRIDIFVKLLALIGQRVGYRFSVAQMNNIYFPNAHGWAEEEWNAIRKGAAELFKGNAALPLALKEGPPQDPKTAELQATLFGRLASAYSEDGALRVEVIDGQVPTGRKAR